ncbi:voltage-dependent T-type calcium channel subunit alpha-1G [Hemitrygon akajei]|uniref:voltage-dependent T-type calcium channel subunit alpha-1G n=1 Tax=Hemitrygon akajei TaxID=2704970 RepID=UPI003BF9BA93
MAEDDRDASPKEGRSPLPSTFIKLNDLDRENKREESEEPGSEYREPPEGAESCGPQQDQDQKHLPYPALAPVVFFYLKQTTRPRSWCLKLVCNPYPFPCPDSDGQDHSMKSSSVWEEASYKVNEL